MTSSQSSRTDWHLACEKSEKSPQIWHLAYESVAQNCHDVPIVALESCGETHTANTNTGEYNVKL